MKQASRWPSPWHGLRGRLLGILLVPLLVLGVASGLIAYRVADATAQSAFDHALKDDAMALAARIAVKDGRILFDLPPAAESVLRTDSEDQEFFSVHGPDGRYLGGDADLSVAGGGRGEPTLSDTALRGHPVRMATYLLGTDAGTVTVAFAETLNKRDTARSQILTALIMPTLLFLVATAVLVTYGVTVGLAPLKLLSRRIEQTPRSDIKAVEAAGVPDEIVPLVGAINRLMADLRASAAAQRTFLSNAAHQLRTPLAGLQTQLELAAEDLPPASREPLARLGAATARVAHLARQLLAVARSAPEASLGHEAERVDLADLVEESASAWYDLATAGGVELDFRLAPAVVIGSSWLLRELVGNLIENAVRHGGPGVHVTVACGGGEAAPMLEVADDGPGIPEDEQARVFDRFYRGSGAAPSGTGLGLAIVRDVAERHGAEITIESGRDARGCRFRIVFPPAAETPG
jgi:two-component system sensor histidine kinase TctE